MFPSQVEVDLTFLMWSISSLVTPNALNDPLLDFALKKAGCNVLPNRHQLEGPYLSTLSDLVVTLEKQQLARLSSVSLCIDGWSDRLLRSWLDVTFSFIDEVDSKWTLSVVHPELIYVGTQSTAKVIASLVNSVCQEHLPDNCLIATTTTDGAANERLAAKIMVDDDNYIHCVGHTAQLAIKDVMDDKTQQTSRFRLVVSKAHNIVVLIRGHSLLQRRFKSLVDKSNGTRCFSNLVKDCVTRYAQYPLTTRAHFVDGTQRYR